MSNSDKNISRELMIGLFVTILGGVIVAWIIREGELFQSKPSSTSSDKGFQAQPTPTNQAPINQDLVAIGVINNNCWPQDYYVDGNLMVSPVSVKSTAVMNVKKGKHWTQACTAGTKNCGSAVFYEWNEPSSISISKHPTCPPGS